MKDLGWGRSDTVPPRRKACNPSTEERFADNEVQRLRDLAVGRRVEAEAADGFADDELAGSAVGANVSEAVAGAGNPGTLQSADPAQRAAKPPLIIIFGSHI